MRDTFQYSWTNCYLMRYFSLEKTTFKNSHFDKKKRLTSMECLDKFQHFYFSCNDSDHELRLLLYRKTSEFTETWKQDF